MLSDAAIWNIVRWSLKIELFFAALYFVNKIFEELRLQQRIKNLLGEDDRLFALESKDSEHKDEPEQKNG